MMLLLFENLRPPQQESQHRSSWSLSFEAGGSSWLIRGRPLAEGDAEVVLGFETTASVRCSNFWLSRETVRVSRSSRGALVLMIRLAHVVRLRYALQGALP